DAYNLRLSRISAERSRLPEPLLLPATALAGAGGGACCSAVMLRSRAECCLAQEAGVSLLRPRYQYLPSLSCWFHISNQVSRASSRLGLQGSACPTIAAVYVSVRA